MSCPKTVGPKSRGRFVKEPKQNISASLVSPKLRSKNVRVAQRFVGLVIVVARFTSQPMVKPLANDSAKCLPQFLFAGEDEVLSGEDSGGIEANFRSGVDAAELGEFQVE